MVNYNTELEVQQPKQQARHHTTQFILDQNSIASIRLCYQGLHLRIIREDCDVSKMCNSGVEIYILIGYCVE
jgi:hypothetical protein